MLSVLVLRLYLQFCNLHEPPLKHWEEDSQRQERPVIIGGWRGPGWRIVAADPAQARQVRDWIRAAINRHHCPADPDEAALVISELYANAGMHGPEGGRVLVGYCLWSAGARIFVCDGGG